jgi:ribosomal protein S5
LLEADQAAAFLGKAIACQYVNKSQTHCGSFLRVSVVTVVGLEDGRVDDSEMLSCSGGSE